MRAAPIDVITIAREYGAGGSELAARLGERLGWPVLDRDLPARVASRMGFDLEAVATVDEQAPSLFARLASAMMVYPPEAPLVVDTGETLSPDAVARAVREEIAAAVRTPPLVVVGHGAQCLLGGRPGTLHVRLVAPVEHRMERIRGRSAADERPDARLDMRASSLTAGAVRRVDDDRQAYLRCYHDAEWRDPLLYDVQINTGRVSIDEAVAVIAGLVAAREGAPAASR